MCGIAGIIHFKGEQVSSSRLKKMTNSMKHRGPDGEGQWIEESGKVGLGHRRLSIIDLSDRGIQPMHDMDQKLVISFNGEIYNYIELKEELTQAGHVFRTETDTEVLLTLYKVYGPQCLKRLDGMFAFAIWDKEKNELFCARDRFGEKPFYYYMDEEQFVFASEIKALWEAGIQKTAAPKMIYDYLLYGSIQDYHQIDKTFYRNIHSLPQANYMLISAHGKLQKTCYWNLDHIQVNRQISLEEAKQQFHSLLAKSIKRRLRSDVPLGSSLSGGLDSSTIVSLINKDKSKSQVQKTFSARFRNFEKDEGKYIDCLLAELEGVEAYSIFPTEESVIENFPAIIEHQEQPFRSLSIAVQFEVMKLAKEKGVTVLLDGQGADEYLAGYDSFYYSYYNQLRQHNKKAYRHEIRCFEQMKGRPFDQSGFKELMKGKSALLFDRVSALRRKTLPATSSYFKGIHPQLVQEFKQSQNPIFKPTNLKEHLKSAILEKGLSELLRYADSNSMANSVEVRLPFLNHDLVEFVFSLPDEFLIHEAWTKFILRESVKGMVPDEIIWRKEKIGYEAPQDKWLKNDSFNKMIEEAKNQLMDEKILAVPDAKFDWNYLMIASYL